MTVCLVFRYKSVHDCGPIQRNSDGTMKQYMLVEKQVLAGGEIPEGARKPVCERRGRP